MGVTAVYELEVDLTPFFPNANGHYMSDVTDATAAVLAVLRLNKIAVYQHIILAKGAVQLFFSTEDSALRADLVIERLKTA